MLETPLTPEQQAFAEQHHGLVLDFMKRHGLDGDYYGLLIERYLRVVVRYLTEEDLRKYRFSTVVWYHLRSELYDYTREEAKRIQQLSQEWYGDIPTPSGEPFDNAMWKKIEEILTYKQYEAILLRNQGYNNREIADLCGVKRKAIEKRFARIRKILSNVKEF